MINVLFFVAGVVLQFITLKHAYKSGVQAGYFLSLYPDAFPRYREAAHIIREMNSNGKQEP